MPILQQDLHHRPALLVSYVFLEDFLSMVPRYRMRNWALDSGAFTAHTEGVEIPLQDYIDCCKRLGDIFPPENLVEVFALDVIGDWSRSLHNTEAMWAQGIEAIPCFHYGEPWDVLVGLSRDYPKIALGALVGQSAGPRNRWIGQCFARVWPKPIHGFGLAKGTASLKFPWQSVDSSTWEKEVAGYGRWGAFKYARLSIRGSYQPLSLEVQHFLDLEKDMRRLWSREMQSLPTPYNQNSPTIRLVVGAGRSVRDDCIDEIFGCEFE